MPITICENGSLKPQEIFSHTIPCLKFSKTNFMLALSKQTKLAYETSQLASILGN